MIRLLREDVMVKVSEIKDWDDSTLDSKVQELRSELFKMKMQGAVSSYEKPHMLKNIKKDIARLLTVKKMKQN